MALMHTMREACDVQGLDLQIDYVTNCTLDRVLLDLDFTDIETRYAVMRRRCFRYLWWLFHSRWSNSNSWGNENASLFTSNHKAAEQYKTVNLTEIEQGCT